jgi:hypothetical protein
VRSDCIYHGRLESEVIVVTRKCFALNAAAVAIDKKDSTLTNVKAITNNGAHGDEPAGLS